MTLELAYLSPTRRQRITRTACKPYGGIWIVVGVASATLGLSIVVPSPGAALGHLGGGFSEAVRVQSQMS